LSEFNTENAKKHLAIEIQNLSFSYSTKKKTFNVCNNINLKIRENEFICLVGPSGCGKTTLLKIIAGFEKPTSGKVYEHGIEIKGMSYKRGVVFQEDAVFPWLTVYDNVEYGLKSRGIQQKIRKEIVEHYINLVGLSKFKYSYPKELSTGMKKRVDIARVLANEPTITLMDEPFGALDAFTKETLQIKLIQIWESSKKTLIFVTHDLEEALFLGDRIALMKVEPNLPLQLYDIPFPRPRISSLKIHAEFQKMRSSIMQDFIYE
jgi:NitT/TauT family transport system ATP-binding protein